MHRDLEQRKVVVVGGGRSGVGAARLLASQRAAVTLVEEQGSVPEASALRALGVSVVEGALTEDLAREAELLVLSPGVSAQHAVAEAARARGVPVIGELELAWRHLDGPVVAVTGTKGKSTTTTLIGRMLAAAGRDVRVGGNIGVALSAQVVEASPGAWHVIETSSFQLETIERFRPDIAVWLNFSVDHLDRHRTEDAYAAAKARIFENQTAEDWAVIPAGDDRIEAFARRGLARVRWFGPAGLVRAGVTATADAIVVRDEDGGERCLVPRASIELKGEHMLTNVMAACAAADLAGIPGEAMVEGVEGFTGLEHVLEPAGAAGGVHFYNDSKATNVDAALKAIEAFDTRVVAIMGGVYKGGDFGAIAAALERRQGEAVVIGAAADRITRALAGRVPVTRAVSMDLAVRTAFERAAGDGVVLLAPARASFDMFRDYAERGRQFKAAVAQLATVAHGGGATDER
jgi:UDP-N-acetylmuramoylalanine--D-glutamate ligase